MTISHNALPAITVLMSCYNAARWLEESINSVLHQTFTDFEFIIVDDGSKDNTLAIMQTFAAKDSRIDVIAKANSGLAESLNVGIQRARGDWIARIDADDICEPDRLEKQIGLARLDEKLVFIGSGLTIIDDLGGKLKVRSYPLHHATLLQHLHTARKFPPHSSAFYRTKTALAVGCYRSRIQRGQDWDLWLRFSEIGKLACLLEPLVQIRKHSGQISHDESGKRQLTDSRMAMVSSWLRRHGMDDPVMADEADYQIFRSWLEAKLVEDGLFEFQAYLAVLRQFAGEVSKSPASITKLIAASARHPAFSIRFIKERLMGETLARRLALEWITQTKNAPK